MRAEAVYVQLPDVAAAVTVASPEAFLASSLTWSPLAVMGLTVTIGLELVHVNFARLNERERRAVSVSLLPLAMASLVVDRLTVGFPLGDFIRPSRMLCAEPAVGFALTADAWPRAVEAAAAAASPAKALCWADTCDRAGANPKQLPTTVTMQASQSRERRVPIFQFAFRARLRNASPPPRRSAARAAIVFTVAPLLTRRPSLAGRSVGLPALAVRFASACRPWTAYVCTGAAGPAEAAARPDAEGPSARPVDDGEGPGSTCCEGPG